MKKHLFTFFLFLPVCLIAQRSFHHVSFYVQGGYRSASYIKQASQKHISSSSETSHHRCIVLNTGLQLDLGKVWRAGFSFTYDHFGTKHRSVEFSNLSYMLRTDYTWMKWKTTSLYSGIAAGLKKTRVFESEMEVSRNLSLTGQVYALGFRYEPFHGFFLEANAGWGVSGIFNLGAGFRF